MKNRSTPYKVDTLITPEILTEHSGKANEMWETWSQYMYYINSYKVLILKSHCYTVIPIMTAILNWFKLLGDNPYYGMLQMNRHCMEYSADRVGTSSRSWSSHRIWP